MITIKPEAAAALGIYRGVLRIQVRTSGCCEPTLAAFWDERRPDDLGVQLLMLEVVLDPDTYRITGPITIDLGSPGDPPGLMLATVNPLSEWAGLTETVIEGQIPK